MEVFQRAEASTFFGREIGIMYTHAHLRYAEALARVGDADGLLPRWRWPTRSGIDRAGLVRPPAPVDDATTRRRTRCSPTGTRPPTDYAGVLDGTVPLEGGWRVYSSGPGLFLRLVVEQPAAASGAAVETSRSTRCSRRGRRPRRVRPLLGRRAEVRYRVGATG